MQSDGKINNAPETTLKIGETANLQKIEGKPSLELDSSTEHEVSVNEAALYSTGREGYDQLLNKYYEIEDQRQWVLQHLNQYTNWNYQNPGPYHASAAQPYNLVSCNCSYGCQNWVVPCDSSFTCLDGPYAEYCNDILKDAKSENLMSQHPDILQTAMEAAKRALSLSTQDAPSSVNMFV